MGQCDSKESTGVKHTTSKNDTGVSKPAVGNFNKTNAGSSSPSSSPQRQHDHNAGAELFLRSFLESAESVLSESHFYNSPAEQQAVVFTFMNTCVDTTRMKFRMKTEMVTDVIAKLGREFKLKVLLKALPDVKERYSDDGFTRLINTWFLNNTGFAKNVDAASGQAMMSALGLSSDGKNLFAFSDILLAYMYAATTVTTLNVFPTFAQGHDIMSEEQYAKFVRDTQRNDLTDAQISDKYKYRFGGVVHRYNFNTYAGCLQTNNALDPARISDVWQDMTQPLTRYFINTMRIESEEDLKQAFTNNCRAFILNLKKNDTGVLCSGSCALQTILDNIKTHGFTANPYPIILCLSPQTRLPPSVQDEVAEKLTATLGTFLAKGLMFEGAIISDPKFSPASQRKKVLVLGYQSKLKPFIGCLVADMNRDGLGVRVTSVLDGTPAAKAGLAKDDWLTHINGKDIRNKQHLRECLAAYQLGEEFTVRRENLEELKVVVGGTVDTNDASASAALSNILFLKYAEDDQLKPWEAQVLKANTIRKSQISRKKLDDHFAFVSGEESSNTSDYIGDAIRMGVQLIDPGNSKKTHTWTNGRFFDNGHSGYLIKSDLEKKVSVTVTIEIIAGPKEIKGPALAKGVASIHGTGSTKTEGKKFTFKGCDETTTAVIDCEFAQNGGSFSFTSAFSPLLLRAGYRVLPLEQTGGPKEIGYQSLAAYCFIRRST